MIIKIFQIALLLELTFPSYSQWQQSIGTASLNMQSLLTKGKYNFAGGATGAYLSIDSAASYISSNNGNDMTGPTRGFTNDNDFFYTCTSQGVYRSADNGASWVSKSNGLTSLLSSGMIHVGSYIFVATPTGVFRSMDQGDHWISAGLSIGDVRCITAMQDTLYAGTNGSGIYKSVNYGDSWVAVNNGLTSTNFRAIQSKGNILFAGGQIGTGVFRSTDFGTSWSLLSGGLPSGSYRGFASNNQLIIAGSFGGGVFYSTDDGDNWKMINTGLSDLTIFDLELNENYIVAATNTQGIFRFALSNLNLTSANDEINKHKESVFIFPNPVTDGIHVEIDQNELGSEFYVINLSGETIFTGKFILKKSIIRLNDLLNGIYFLRIGQNSKRVFKVIKN